MNNAWLSLLFALVVAELAHNAVEIWGMRQKVGWLTARIDELEHSKWPINIDTNAKTAVLHTAILVVLAGPVWLAAEWLNWSSGSLVAGSIVLLLVSFIYTTVSVNTYHQEIGKLLERYKRSNW